MELSVEKNTILSIQCQLQHCWAYAISQGYAAAIWRLPFQNYVYFLADKSGKPQKISIDFEEPSSGFCISKFAPDQGSEALLLKHDILLKFDLAAKKLLQDNLSAQELAFLEESEKIELAEKKGGNLQLLEFGQEQYEFVNLVSKAVDAMKAGAFKKVVLSRNKSFKLEHPLSVGDLINSLIQKYPKAFVSACYLPAAQCIWLGASPELLASIDEMGIFKTVALAGTQSALDSDKQPIEPGDARWSQKEIEEQALVSRYIIDCLKKVRVREFEEYGPKTVQAGNLLHLQTEFLVDTKDIAFEHFATVMLQLLNPTSAVCGMPKSEALEFIAQHENYNREYYAGFCGPKNIEYRSDLYVNLRCMKIEGQKATFYAGAGITEDSKPEREWKETELKIETLLSILNA